MNIDPEVINKIIAGGSGSAIAAWIAKATGFNLFMMFVGGLSAAWFLSPAVADFFGLKGPRSEPAVGFVIGFLGIILMRKALEVIDKIDWATVLGKALEKFGLKKSGE